MTKNNLLLSLVVSGIVCVALAGDGEASVPRAFVSISGSDTNPCSAVQPCRSFNQALTVVEASGEIVVQDSGGYSTGFTITQSVTIDAAGVNASVICTSDSDLCTINAGASDRVVLRGISFHGANFNGNAIHVAQVGSLYVEHCSIAEFGNGTALSGCGVRMQSGGNLFVTDTNVRACRDAGLRVETSGATATNLVAQDSVFEEDCFGIALQTGGPGAATGWVSNCTASRCCQGFFVGSNSSGPGNADLTLTNCRAFGDSQTGFAAQNLSGSANAIMRIANCVASGNAVGVTFVSQGNGAAAVFGTGPGTNLITGNGSNGSTAASATLQ
jgi:hypothetical protein